jgi:hypothetical protein
MNIRTKAFMTMSSFLHAKTSGEYECPIKKKTAEHVNINQRSRRNMEESSSI